MSSTVLSPSAHHDASLFTNGSTAAEWSNAALERRAAQMRAEAEERSAALTQQLATTLSGQNLLHMGQQLNNLIPPNLHALVQHLAPLSVEPLERALQPPLSRLQRTAAVCLAARDRAERAQHAVHLYQDLCGAERGMTNAATLERTATRALYLSECHRVAQSVVVNAASANDMPQYEFERFVVRLGPRIRKLEQETVWQLGRRWEDWLVQYTQRQQPSPAAPFEESPEERPLATTTPTTTETDAAETKEEAYFTDLGHIVRGLVLLGRAKEVETIFTQTAIRPLLQTHLSLGRIDQGGARGECAGLGAVLQDLLQDLQRRYRPIWMRLQTVDLIQDEVDLITHSIWVPLVAALMKDAALRMAIFAPGLAPVWHANYTTLVDGVMANWAPRLLGAPAVETGLSAAAVETGLSTAAIQRVQDRIDQHPMTAEFLKRWNLPIYYQLRFGECGTRLQRALEATQWAGWAPDEVHDQSDAALHVAWRERTGLQFPLFLELYEILHSLWRPDIWVRPLTHRFLRGAVQLLGRVVAFCQEGLDGKLLFGPPPESSASDAEAAGPPAESNAVTVPQYCWGDRENEVAAVMWELDRLEAALRQDYTQVICDTLQSATTGSRQESEDLEALIREVLQEASELIVPVIDHGWKNRIIPMLIAKCAGPLGAVKGVAATYRMTNRPPPTLSSPFVATILRPVRELAATAQIPARISWKAPIVATIAQRYAAAVADLLSTVQRAEESLSKRKGRATRPSGAMSDADKVKLQLYLDYQAFVESVRELGDVDPSTLDGITQLGELTQEGAALYQAPAAKAS
jgi:conserved oligomeric Golgi complex subunit 2